jgi:L-aspartate oxidase
VIKLNIIKSDVVIIGAGLAGLYTALNINPELVIDIIVKEDFNDTNSKLAQGGIAGVLSEIETDRALHVEDTLKAGSFLNDAKSVNILVNEARENIIKLMNYDVPFDKDTDGNFHTTKEGGHSRNRIFHAGGDKTGQSIMLSLKPIVRSRSNIRIHTYEMAIDISRNNNNVCGVYTLNNNNEIVFYSSQNIVIAAGGLGNIYGSSTNSTSATGDGYAIALRAGAQLENMEFVQFHPTAFHNTKNYHRQKFLLTEALRGEGATLINSEGERFMSRYHTDMELAPRDVVSQAIYREMYDTWTDHVYLDTRHLDKKFLQNRFPGVFDHLRKNGFKLGVDLIPVSPVQHFMVGGIKVDYNGKTDLDGLYAVGEVASTGVHGANRLASNSLLECIVFGNRVAKNINQNISVCSIEKSDRLSYQFKQYDYASMKKKLGQIMDEFVGIVRTKDGLLRAQKDVKKMLSDLTNHPNLSKYYFEAVNMVTTSLSIIEGSLRRKESIGCHLRLN